MATKPSANNAAPDTPKTAVAEVAKTGTAVVTWKDRMEMVRAQAAASEAPKGGFLSFKGGHIAYNEEYIPGDKLGVVVIDFVLENSVFKEKYNPNKPASPMCYAFGRDETDMVPHEDCEEPQHDACDTCPRNEWGSDPEGGRGKACKNSRRIAVLPYDTVMKGPEAIRKAQVVMCKLPVTSIKNFSGFVTKVVKVLEKAPFEVQAELSVTPSATNLFSVNWKAMGVIEDQEILEALYSKRESIEKLLYQPYPKFEDEQPASRSNKY